MGLSKAEEHHCCSFLEVRHTTPRGRLGTPGTDRRERDAAARASWAGDPPGDRPRLWCDEPPFDGCPVVGEQLLLKGWALACSGSDEISVEVDVGKRLKAHCGLCRTDVRDALPGVPGAARSGWMLRLTTSGWSPGLHELTITARDGEGNETTLTRRIELDPAATYRGWLARREATLPPPEAGRRLAASREAAPRLLVCLIASDADSERLRRTLRSLEGQSYPNWSLVTAGLDTSVDERAEPPSSPARTGEGHARVEDLAGGLRMFLEGESDYIVLAHVGDVIAPHALLAFAERAIAPDPPRVLYTDADVLDGEGNRCDPFFKPGWSPELLLGMDYIGPFACVARASARRAVDLDPLPIGSVYELLLRLADEEQRVDRIPDVLYSSSGGTRDDEVRARELIGAVARRRGKRARIAPLDHPGTRHVAWELEGTPTVSIVIATARRDDLVLRCLDSIRQRTAYPEYEVVLVEPPDGAPREVELPGIECRIVSSDQPLNRSAARNLGARVATGDYLQFLDGDTEVDSPDWIERLLEQVQQPGVGVAGGKLVFPDGTLALGGVLAVDHDPPAHAVGEAFPADDPGYRGLLSVARNTSAVGGACLMIGRGLFAALEGFEERLGDLADVDLCLRALGGGDRVVWTPRAVLRTQEGAPGCGRAQPRDRSRFRHRWGDTLEAGDPYYNPNLSTEPGEDYQLRTPAAQPLPTSAPETPAGERPSEERFVPETMGGLIQAEHEGRYRWAATVVAGREVLDAGCGVGYGAEMLAEAGASRIVGLDVSPEAVEDAVFRAGAIGQFEVGDLERMPFAPRSFDVVVCFEAIEHVNRGELALDELRRVLRPDGLLILSSPNRHVYLPGNPYHVHEYTPSELHAALTQRFRHVALYRQHPWITSLITDDAGLGARSSAVEIASSVRKVVGAAPGEELYTLAVAGDAPLPSMQGTAVLTDPVDLKAWEDQMAQLREAFQAREQALRAEVRAARDALEAMESSVSWRVTSPLRSTKRRFAAGPPEAR